LAVGDHEVIYTWTDPAGCVVMSTPVVASLLPATEVNILDVGTLCLDGGGVVLFGSHSGIWSGSVSGEGNHVYFDPAMLGIGTWPVTLTASSAGACPGTATLDVVVSPCLGVAAATDAVALHAWPNPFSGDLFLQADLDGQLAVEIVDATGRLVRSFTQSGNGTQPIDLSGEPNGTYVLRVFAAGSWQHLRIVKVG